MNFPFFGESFKGECLSCVSWLKINLFFPSYEEVEFRNTFDSKVFNVRHFTEGAEI